MSEANPVTLSGIANCDQVRKARAWFAEKGIAHVFHDFKKSGLSAAQLRSWIDGIGWERLLNRNGTTWRTLDVARKATIVDAGQAESLMLELPSIIRRPILQVGNQLLVGFEPTLYEAALRSVDSRS